VHDLIAREIDADSS